MEPDPIEQVGTCHTGGCANDGVAITLLVAPGTPWVCGVCGQPITDLTPPLTAS